MGLGAAHDKARSVGKGMYMGVSSSNWSYSTGWLDHSHRPRHEGLRILPALFLGIYGLLLGITSTTSRSYVGMDLGGVAGQ